MAERQQVGKYGSGGARMRPVRRERTNSARWASKLESQVSNCGL